MNPRAVLWAPLALTLIGAGLLLADSYRVYAEYSVACLELETGKTIWRTKPEALKPVAAVVGKNFLKIDSVLHTKTGKKEWQTWIDVESGKVLESAPEEKESTQGYLEPLKRSLTDSRGRVFEFDPGNTRHLFANVKGTRRLIKNLEDFPYDLNVVGDLAVFTYCHSISSNSTGGGQVHAWNLRKNAQAWTFDARTEVLGIKASSYTGVFVDGDRVLVSVEQHLLALTLATGTFLWKTALPPQKIRRYDSPWTTVGRLGNRLFVRCYEDLFVLSATNGKLHWSYDCGWFGKAWPLVRDGKVYVFPYGK